MDCIEFETHEAKRSIQLDVTPYIGIIQYKIPSGSSIGLYSSPDLSFLAGVTFAITNKSWMSAFSGCFDVSLSRITSSAQTLTANVFKHSGTMLSGKLGIRYTYPKGMIRPFAELGIDISSILNGKERTNR